MRKVKTGAVILGEDNDHALRKSVEQVTLLFLPSSFRDALYLSLVGSVRMLLLLSKVEGSLSGNSSSGRQW